MKDWEKESNLLKSEKFHKGIGKDLEARLNKRYSVSSRIDSTFRGNDITFLRMNLENLLLYLLAPEETMVI